MSDLTRYRRHLRAQGYSPLTVREKVGVIDRVARAAGVDPAALTAEHVEDYLASRALATWSRRTYLGHLRAWASWAGLPDPTEGLRRPPQPRGVPRPVSEDDLAAMLAVANDRTRAFLVLGAYAGLRSAETAAVRGDDLSREPDGPVLRVVGKGGHVDVIPAAFLVVRELAPWIAQAAGGRLWPGTTPPAVRAAVRYCAEQAGVQVTSHQLRHRFGTQLYAASHDLLLTQRLMRHASPAQTAGYAKVSDVAGAALVNRLPLPGLRSVEDAG